MGVCTAAMGATFALTESAVANYRQKTDPINGAAGGCAAGFLAGVRGSCQNACIRQVIELADFCIGRSIPMALGGCVVLGAAMGTFDLAGQLSPEKNVSREEKRNAFFKQPIKPIVDSAEAP